MTCYYDLTGADGGIGILPEPGEIAVLTGVVLHTEPAKYRGEKSDAFIRDFDFHFWFDDEEPEVTLYAVPRIEVGGYDSEGGLFAGSIDFTLSRAKPMYYIDKDRRCHLITSDSREFLAMGRSWRERMTHTDAIEIFPTKEEARKKYNICDVESLEDILK